MNFYPLTCHTSIRKEFSNTLIFLVEYRAAREQASESGWGMKKKIKKNWESNDREKMNQEGRKFSAYKKWMNERTSKRRIREKERREREHPIRQRLFMSYECVCAKKFY